MAKFHLVKILKIKEELIINSIDDNESFEILIPRSKYLNVQEGDFVKERRHIG